MKHYDASKEFTPFERAKECPTRHPRHRNGRTAKDHASRGKRGPNVRIRVLVNNDIRQGYSFVRLRDGVKVS